MAHLYELEKGASRRFCPSNTENEEPLFVLAGMPTLRRGREDGRTLAPGKLVSFPAGPVGSHQILNGATEPALGSIAAIPTTSRTSGGQVENDQVDVGDANRSEACAPLCWVMSWKRSRSGMSSHLTIVS